MIIFILKIKKALSFKSALVKCGVGGEQYLSAYGLNTAS